MPKVTGIALEGTELRVVELEGSSRRFRLTQAFLLSLRGGEAAGEGEEPQGGGEKEEKKERIRSLAAALKERKVQREHVALVLDGKDAFVRNAKVELKGEEQIRKVIKFEAEGVFQTLDVDDVIVDFLPCKEVEDGTEVLIAAVPKGVIRDALERVRGAGLDPEVLELDAVALYRGAQALGCLDPEKDQVVLELGLRSGKILLVNKGALVALRTLRFGLETFLPTPVAAGAEEEEEEGRESRSGEGESGGEDLSDLPRPDPDSLEAYAERVAREVKRFLAGFAAGMEIEDLLATGRALAAGDVLGMVSTKLGAGIRPLAPLERVEHSLDEEEAARLEGSLLPALGAALELMGAAEAGMNFRQEEFQYSRKFERVKFPLVVCLMLLAFFLVLQYTKASREALVYRYYLGSPTAKGKLGRSGLIPRVWSAYVAPSLPADKARKFRIPPSGVPISGVLSWYKARLSEYKRSEERRLGYYPDLPPLESGLHVLRVFAWFMEKARSRFSGKVLVTALDLRLDAGKKTRFLTFDLLFWGDQARRDFDEMRRVWEEVCRADKNNPYKDSPFQSFEPSKKETPTNPPGGFWRKGNKLILKPEIPVVETWPPKGEGS